MDSLEELNCLLDRLEIFLDKVNLNGRFDYRFRMGYVNDVGPEFNRTRPSYNMILLYNKSAVAAVNYEIDKRFTLRVRDKERGRIKNFLAKEMMTTIGLYGVLYLINGRSKENMIMTSTHTEEDEKSSYGLRLN
jgi:hypothetical protein